MNNFFKNYRKEIFTGVIFKTNEFALKNNAIQNNN